MAGLVTYGRRFATALPMSDLDPGARSGGFDPLFIHHAPMAPGGARAPERVGADHADLVCGPHRRLRMDRAGRTATLLGPALGRDELTHPFLHPIAAIGARWDGCEVVAAGGFVAGEEVWGVLGEAPAAAASCWRRWRPRGWASSVTICSSMTARSSTPARAVSISWSGRTARRGSCAAARAGGWGSNPWPRCRSAPG